MAKPAKPPRRWTPPAPRRTEFRGGYFGIKDPEAAAVYGWMLSYWPHVEEHMAGIFEELITGKGLYVDPSVTHASREIFTAIIAQRTRINIMRSLLREAPHNVGKSQLFDEIIDEFDKLNVIRNDYVHGLWTWNEERQELLLVKPSAELLSNSEPTPVTVQELTSTFQRMRDLVNKINSRFP